MKYKNALFIKCLVVFSFFCLNTISTNAQDTLLYEGFDNNTPPAGWTDLNGNWEFNSNKAIIENPYYSLINLQGRLQSSTINTYTYDSISISIKHSYETYDTQDEIFIGFSTDGGLTFDIDNRIILVSGIGNELNKVETIVLPYLEFGYGDLVFKLGADLNHNDHHTPFWEQEQILLNGDWRNGGGVYKARVNSDRPDPTQEPQTIDCLPIEESITIYVTWTNYYYNPISLDGFNIGLEYSEEDTATIVNLGIDSTLYNYYIIDTALEESASTPFFPNSGIEVEPFETLVLEIPINIDSTAIGMPHTLYTQFNGIQSSTKDTILYDFLDNFYIQVGDCCINTNITFDDSNTLPYSLHTNGFMIIENTSTINQEQVHLVSTEYIEISSDFSSIPTSGFFLAKATDIICNSNKKANTTVSNQSIETKIYPNPFNDYLIVKVHDDIIIKKIHLFNTMGNLVANLDVNEHSSKKYITNLESLPPGIYFLMIDFGHSTERIKVVKG